MGPFSFGVIFFDSAFIFISFWIWTWRFFSMSNRSLAVRFSFRNWSSSCCTWTRESEGSGFSTTILSWLLLVGDIYLGKFFLLPLFTDDLPALPDLAVLIIGCLLLVLQNNWFSNLLFLFEFLRFCVDLGTIGSILALAKVFRDTTCVEFLIWSNLFVELNDSCSLKSKLCKYAFSGFKLVTVLLLILCFSIVLSISLLGSKLTFSRHWSVLTMRGVSTSLILLVVSCTYPPFAPLDLFTKCWALTPSRFLSVFSAIGLFTFAFESFFPRAIYGFLKFKFCTCFFGGRGVMMSLIDRVD